MYDVYFRIVLPWKQHKIILFQSQDSEVLFVDNWNDNCEAKSEAKRPRPLRGLQVDFSLTRNVSYAVR